MARHGPASTVEPRLDARATRLEGPLVHDDDIREPETTTIKTTDMSVEGNISPPPEDISKLIVAESLPDRGPGAIQEALLKKHNKDVPLEWVVYVLEERRKAAKRQSR